MEFATRKGARQADVILEAAVRSLGKRGYAATSIQRIADEAGTSKRMVHYYWETRERLFEEVVRRVGDRLLDQVEEAISGLESPAEIVAVGFDRVWSGIKGDPELQAVYFGLVAESVTDPSLKKTISYVNDRYRRIIGRLIEVAKNRGEEIRWDEGSLTVLIVAGIQGLTLHFLERGDTPELRKATEDFQRWMVFVTQPPADRGR